MSNNKTQSSLPQPQGDDQDHQVRLLEPSELEKKYQQFRSEMDKQLSIRDNTQYAKRWTDDDDSAFTSH